MNATYLRTFLLEYIYVFREILSTYVFFAALFTLRQPKTPISNAMSMRTFCFEDYHCAFQETLSCDTRSSDLFTLYFYTSDIFPILRFSQIELLCTNFFLCICHAKYFLIPEDAAAWNLIIIIFLISAVKGLIGAIFFFRTFIVLIQWNFP